MVRLGESLQLVIVTCALALVSAAESVNLPRCDSILRNIHPELFTHCVCTWSEWKPVANSFDIAIPVDPSLCSSGKVFLETRFSSGPEVGCGFQNETRAICKLFGVGGSEQFNACFSVHAGMPDREDRLIMALGLGSIGHMRHSTVDVVKRQSSHAPRCPVINPAENGYAICRQSANSGIKYTTIIILL